MTHEPECAEASAHAMIPKDGNDCWVCDRIRAAYQRGREDAAQAVMNHVAPDNCLGDDCCAAAARGGGEQK